MIGAPAFRLSGVVRDATGRPVANALVKLVEADAQQPRVFMGPMLQTRTDGFRESSRRKLCYK